MILLQQFKFLAGKEQFKKAPLKTGARLGIWKVHCWLSRGAVVRLEDTALRMSLPPHWHGHPKLLFALGWRFDPELAFLANRLSVGDVVFDIGANIGTWSLILSEAVGASGKIFAYEPTQSTYEILSKNVLLNERRNIFAFRYALSNSDGRMRLYHDVDCSRNSFGATREGDPSDSEEVPTRTLDSLVAELQIDKLDFLKIDVEGAERLVFEGAAETLSRFLPAILFEVNHGALDELGLEYDSSWRVLAALGYRFYDLRTEEKTLEEIFDCPEEDGTVWAIHPEKSPNLLTDRLAAGSKRRD